MFHGVEEAIYRVRNLLHVVRWGSALSEQNHAFPDHVTHPRESITHEALSPLHFLTRIASVPPPFSFTFVTARSSIFPQMECLRITRLVSRLAIPIAPRGHPPSGSRRPQTPHQSARIRESHRRFRRTMMYIDCFPPACSVRTFPFTLLAHLYFCSVLVPYVSRLQ